MAAPYPGGGTPDPSQLHLAVHPISEHLAYTGINLTPLWVGLAVVGAGLVMWAIAFAWRK